jgi:cytochrome c peroxidase
MSTTRIGGFLMAVTLLLPAACDDTEVTAPEDPDAARFQEIIDEFDLGPLPTIPYPSDNRFNAERISLGKLLFFDPILGGESAPRVKREAGLDPYRNRANDVACATCHFPTFAFADARRLGAGVSGAQFRDTDLGPARVVPGPSLVTGEPVGTEPRNTPTVLNTAFNGKNSIEPRFDSFQFMDGRVTDGLEEQATLPITSRDEMAGDAYGVDFGRSDVVGVIQDSVTRRIRSIPEYVARFRQAFAGEVREADDITIEHIGRAIAAYERELITPGSRYDRFVSGDFSALTEQEQRGFELFFGKGLCGDCHSGVMLSDFTFRVIGASDDYEEILPGFEGKNGEGGDFGRFHADPERFAGRKFAFRNPTIRNVELTAPYFHSGNMGTLREVVEFYDRGGRGEQDMSDEELEAAGVVRDPAIRPLGLTDAEIDAIVAFMKTTTAPVRKGPIDLMSVPPRVPSGLLPPGVETPDEPGPYYMIDEESAITGRR